MAMETEIDRMSTKAIELEKVLAEKDASLIAASGTQTSYTVDLNELRLKL